jgi:hypothetical protein
VITLGEPDVQQTVDFGETFAVFQGDLRQKRPKGLVKAFNFPPWIPGYMAP